MILVLGVGFGTDQHFPQDEGKTVNVTSTMVGLGGGNFGGHVSPGTNPTREIINGLGTIMFRTG